MSRGFIHSTCVEVQHQLKHHPCHNAGCKMSLVLSGFLFYTPFEWVFLRTYKVFLAKRRGINNQGCSLCHHKKNGKGTSYPDYRCNTYIYVSHMEHTLFASTPLSPFPHWMYVLSGYYHRIIKCVIYTNKLKVANKMLYKMCGYKNNRFCLEGLSIQLVLKCSINWNIILVITLDVKCH